MLNWHVARGWRWALNFALFLLPSLAVSDEGLWLYNRPPTKLLEARYGFTPSPNWLNHLQRASIRFGTGSSAEFVSKDGLLLSNHHVGAGALQRISTKEQNYYQEGFYARTLADEKPCPGVELYVLQDIEDVTVRVNEAVAPGLSDTAAHKARRAIFAKLEIESFERTGLRSEMVTLFQGAEYHLYRYKIYSDVRLVFAPEEQIAFFGGDPDNFEYPRFDLDICFFRAYENGKPALTEHYLKWSKSGAADGELVFASGHPARTDRLRTMAELEFMRDSEYPRSLARLKRLESLLGAYSARSLEQERQARNDLRSVENSRKARDGVLHGLMDPGLMAQKREQEERLRQAVLSTPDLVYAAGAWDRIAQAQQGIAALALKYDLLERGYGFNSTLFSYARHVVRTAEERPKPDGERLEEYRDSARARLENELLTVRPLHVKLEAAKLGDSFVYLAESLGFTSPLVQRVFDGQTAQQRAAHIVRDTRLGSPQVRRELYEGGAKALANSKDPAVELARIVDAEARAVRSEMEPFREAIRQAHAQIGKARYHLYGNALYPDATSTLRLSYGEVKGYDEDGRHVPFQTTFAGLYERAKAQQFRPPFDLPEGWLKARKRLKLSTALNFVCTADITGGNSGSPVVNRNGELVGVIFDSNLQALVGDFIYTQVQGRAQAVHSSGILEALRRVYRADRLVRELVQ